MTFQFVSLHSSGVQTNYVPIDTQEQKDAARKEMKHRNIVIALVFESTVPNPSGSDLKSTKRSFQA
jgi:hypothetical protein